MTEKELSEKDLSKISKKDLIKMIMKLKKELEYLYLIL